MRCRYLAHPSSSDNRRQACDCTCVLSSKEVLRIFSRERSRFARYFGHISGATLQIVDRPCLVAGCELRSVADADVSTGQIRIVNRLLGMGTGTVTGVLRHELGHLADSDISRDEAELRADAIALLVTGEPVRYNRRLIQTSDSTGIWPRPRSLHR